MASTGRSIRAMSGRSVESLFNTQLPRGPVPPSMPSPCHNKLDLQNQSKLSDP
ncbi:unnamed protein product, partial [Ilex paraguariensis]